MVNNQQLAQHVYTNPDNVTKKVLCQLLQHKTLPVKTLAQILFIQQLDIPCYYPLDILKLLTTERLDGHQPGTSVAPYHALFCKLIWYRQVHQHSYQIGEPLPKFCYQNVLKYYAAITCNPGPQLPGQHRSRTQIENIFSTIPEKIVNILTVFVVIFHHKASGFIRLATHHWCC